MERFDDLPEDFDLSRSIDDLKSMVDVLRRTNEKNQLLSAAISGLGKDEMPSTTGREGAYGYIPIDLNQFIDMMLSVEKLLSEDSDYKHSEKPHRPCSFLEVGCGIGRNLHVLRATDRFTLEKITGFDIEPDYIKLGRKVFGIGEDIFVDDALTFDYGGYDIIYFYRPFHDEPLQKKFEKRLIETARRGAYILAQLDSSLEKSRSLIAKDTANGIYKRL